MKKIDWEDTNLYSHAQMKKEINSMKVLSRKPMIFGMTSQLVAKLKSKQL